MPKPTGLRQKKAANPSHNHFLSPFLRVLSAFAPLLFLQQIQRTFLGWIAWEQNIVGWEMLFSDSGFNCCDMGNIWPKSKLDLCSLAQKQQHWSNPSEENVQTKKWQQYLGCLGSQWTQLSTDLGSSVKKIDGKTRREAAVEKREWKSRKIWSLI